MFLAYIEKCQRHGTECYKSGKHIFQNSFIDIYQAQSRLAIVYTRDACNEDFCSIMVMNTLTLWHAD